MPVGVAVLDQPLPEPHDPLHPEPRAQLGLDLLARQRRVAVRVEQALLGRQQRPLAVGQDRAALEHERRARGPRRRAARRSAADGGVAVPGRELLAPGVEAEVDRDPVGRRRRRRRSGRSHAATSRRAAARRSRRRREHAAASQRRRPRPGWRSSSPARTRRPRSRPRRSRLAPGRSSRPTARAGTASPSASARGAPIRPAFARRAE